MDTGKEKAKRPLRVKVISMGNSEVGKSCIIKRYCEKRFVHKYLATIGIDYGVTKVHIKDRDVKVNIFDMAGHPIFYEVRNEFYKDTQGAVLVYDCTSKESFEALDTWLNEMKREIGNPADMENVVFCVCANKTDRQKRAIDEAEGRIWADTHGCYYFETSAQTGEGINEMFQTLFSTIVEACENGGKPPSISTSLGYTKEQTLFSTIVEACENGGKPPSISTSLGYTKEQAEAIQRLKNSKSDWERLGLYPGSSKDEINKAYRRLAVLLHPDKNVAPGSEEAFKILVSARTALLRGK